MISSILLAAGQSKRMQGENKLLKKYKKKYLINHILNSLIKSKVNKIIVVLGYENRKIKEIELSKIIDINKANLGKKYVENFLLSTKFADMKVGVGWYGGLINDMSGVRHYPACDKNSTQELCRHEKTGVFL